MAPKIGKSDPISGAKRIERFGANYSVVWEKYPKLLFSGRKMTQKGPKMALYTTERNFAIKKINQYFSIVNYSFCRKIQTNTMVNDPILDLKMAHFTQKWVFHKKI